MLADGFLTRCDFKTWLLLFILVVGPATHIAATTAAELAKFNVRSFSELIHSKTDVTWFGYKLAVIFSFLYTCTSTFVAGVVNILPTTVCTIVFIVYDFSN